MIPLPAWLTLTLLKKAAPWIAGALIVACIFLYGYSKGVSKWKGKYESANVSAQQNADEVDKLKAAVEEQNLSIEQWEKDKADELERVEQAHRTALARQASSYRRAIEQRDRDAAELRERVKLLTVAETCHEAWVEVTQ